MLARFCGAGRHAARHRMDCLAARLPAGARASWVRGLGIDLRPELSFAWWYHFDAYAPRIFLEAPPLPRRRVCSRRVWPLPLGCTGRLASRSPPTARRAGQPYGISTRGSSRRRVHSGRWDRQALRHEWAGASAGLPPTRAARASAWSCDPALLDEKRHRPRHQGRNWQVTRAGARNSPIAAVRSHEPTLRRLPIPCSRYGAASGKCADVQNIADVLWSIPKALWSAGTLGEDSHALLVAPSCTYSMRRRTDPGRRSGPSFPIPPGPIEQTLRAMMTTPHLGQRAASIR